LSRAARARSSIAKAADVAGSAPPEHWTPVFAAIGLWVSTAAVDSELTVTPGLRHAVQLKWTAIVHEAENAKYHIRFSGCVLNPKGG